MSDETRYFVVDVETDGPLPGNCSLRNLSMVVTNQDIDEIDSFTVNLAPVAGAKGDPETMQWWESQPEVWQRITANQQPPARAMERFRDFVLSHDARRIFVGHPLIFDGLWVNHYMSTYLGKGLMASHADSDPLFFGAGIDLPSFVSGALKIDYGLCRHGRYPDAVATDLPHTHFGLDDARGHADVFKRTSKLTGGLNVSGDL